VSANTAIEWTERTWNPTTGCDRVSDGCDNCYALTLAKRLKAMGSAKYQTDGDPRTSGPGFGLAVHPDSLDAPLHWRKPQKVFVNSMSDLFHNKVPDEFIARVFAVMALSERHTFQVLTKRHARLRSLVSNEKFQRQVLVEMHREKWAADVDAPAWRWPLPNVWIGVSVENQQWADIRIPMLMKTPAAVRFLSCEPLLGPITLHRGHAYCPTHDFVGGFCTGPCADLITPDWVIAGGESGDGHRPLDLDWVRLLRDQASAAGAAFLFKQVGGRTPKAGGRLLDGRTWDEYPVVPMRRDR
jgi:protein gp37